MALCCLRFYCPLSVSPAEPCCYQHCARAFTAFGFTVHRFSGGGAALSDCFSSRMRDGPGGTPLSRRLRPSASCSSCQTFFARLCVRNNRNRRPHGQHHSVWRLHFWLVESSRLGNSEVERLLGTIFCCRWTIRRVYVSRLSAIHSRRWHRLLAGGLDSFPWFLSWATRKQRRRVGRLRRRRHDRPDLRARFEAYRQPVVRGRLARRLRFRRDFFVFRSQ